MSNTELALEAIELSKKYGSTIVVDRFSLELERGDIFGLLGTNGAGKTTVIKMLATLVKPSSGCAYIYGYDTVRDPGKIRAIIGHVPDVFRGYGELKVWEYLDFFAAAYKIPKSERIGIIADVMELMDLNTAKNRRIAGLSRGMKQRVCIAKALVHDPQVLLLDEPAAGLDPRARHEIKEIFMELGNMGKTILISSNILPELADFCNKIGIMEAGKLLFIGTVDEMRSVLGWGFALEIRIRSDLDRAREILEQVCHVKETDVQNGVMKVVLDGNGSNISGVLSRLIQERIEVTGFQEVKPDIEKAFLKLTEGVVS